MRNDQGRYIHIDGIDGSGKSTLLEAARVWAAQNSLRVFDVVAWSKAHDALPTLEDIGDADMILTAEPTHVGVGRIIREEIIRTGSPYSARAAAEAFSVDRSIQHTRLITPFLQSRPGHWVIQDRGLMSSIAYQLLQTEQEEHPHPLTLDDLLRLDGNRIALDAHPDIFVFIDIDPAVAQSRLQGRTEKNDNHRFEVAEFQTLLAERYRHPHLRAPLEERGTRFIHLDGSSSRERMAEQMMEILATLR